MAFNPRKQDPDFGYSSAEDAELHRSIYMNPRPFEWGLLAALIYDSKVFAAADTLLLSDQRGNPIEDFSIPSHKTLYQALKIYHKQTHYAFYQQPSMSGVMGALNQITANNFDTSPDQIPELLQQFSEACRMYQSAPQYFSDQAKRGLVYWLQDRRLAEYHKRKQELGWTSVQFSQEWSTEQIHLKNSFGQSDESIWYSIENCLMWEPVKVFLTLPWTGVNTKMGGGIARGDATLIVGSTGAGKTVVGSQIAGHFAINCEAKGVYISTEQKGPGVLPRMVSCFSGVPYSLVNKHRSVQLGDMTQDIRAKVERPLIKLRDNHFHFRDWKAGDSVITGMRSIVDYYCNKLSPDGTIDFIIMDWIGGSLEQGAKDKDEARSRMQHAADTLAMLADELDIATLATAQANPLQTAKTSQVGGQHLAECKTMHRHFENLIGISGLQDLQVNEDTDDISTRYAKDQYLYIDKCRFGTGGSVPVKQMFHVQRMEERFGKS